MFPTHASDQKRKVLSTTATVCMHNLMIMGMKASHVWFCMLLILMCSVSYSSGQGCDYRVEVKTGDRNWAGTAATVNLHLCSTRTACFLHVPDLARFGLAGPSYPYFRLGNHDFFRIPSTQSCQEVCKISIGHNNAGSSPGWFLDYVKVDVYDGGVLKYRDLFRVYQWIARGSAYSLQVEVNHCPVKAAAAQLASVLPLQSGVA